MQWYNAAAAGTSSQSLINYEKNQKKEREKTNLKMKKTQNLKMRKSKIKNEKKQSKLKNEMNAMV